MKEQDIVDLIQNTIERAMFASHEFPLPHDIETKYRVIATDLFTRLVNLASIKTLSEHRDVKQTLNQMWAEINALGGTYDHADEHGRGRDDAVGEALAIIEKAGGRDPLSRESDGIA